MGGFRGYFLMLICFRERATLVERKMYALESIENQSALKLS